MAGVPYCYDPTGTSYDPGPYKGENDIALASDYVTYGNWEDYAETFLAVILKFNNDYFSGQEYSNDFEGYYDSYIKYGAMYHVSDKRNVSMI